MLPGTTAVLQRPGSMPFLAQIDVASGDYLKALHNSYTEEEQATLCKERNFSHPGLS
jgi:hypothetical protein